MRKKWYRCLPLLFLVLFATPSAVFAADECQHEMSDITWEDYYETFEDGSWAKGKIGHYKCLKCNEEDYQPEDAMVGSSVFLAGCEKWGGQKCWGYSHGAFNYTVYDTPPLGHQMGDVTYTVEEDMEHAPCLDGCDYPILTKTAHYSCTRAGCDAKDYKLEGTTTKTTYEEAGCETPKYEVVSTYLGDLLIQEVKTPIAPATGHTCSEVTYTTTETINENGNRVVTKEGHYYCTTCNEENYYSGASYCTMNIVEPTCETEGYILSEDKEHGISKPLRITYEYTSDALGHDWSEWQTTVEPTVDSTGIATRTCSRCEKEETKVLDQLAGEVVSPTITPTVPSTENKKQSIAEAHIASIKDQAYSKKAICPTVQVSLNGSLLRNGKDYTVSYQNNKKIGKATVIVNGCGDYTGTVKKTFKIVPAKVSLTKTKKSGKKVLVKWKKTNCSGYEVTVSNNKKFTKNVKKYIVKGKSSKKVVSRKYVRVRAYKVVNGVKYYGKYSTVKIVRGK